MKVDEKATKAARARQEAGLKRLESFFGFTPQHAPFIPQTGRSMGARKIRLMWRNWRDDLDPTRVRRRKHRKAARASRKRNR
jgi:hypothetical protein